MSKLNFISIKYIIVLIIFATISALLSYYIYRSSTSLYSEAENAITQLQMKRKAVTGMMRSARERSILLLNMYIEQDVFNRDEIKMDMTTEAHHFNRSKSEFENTKLSDEEKAVFVEVMDMVKSNAPVHLQAADLMVNNEMERANELLFNIVIPKQQDVLQKFDEILALIDVNVSQEIIKLKTLQRTTTKYILQLILLVLAGAFAFFFVIHSRTKIRESELKKLVAERTRKLEQAHAQVDSLVANSSDGIISIDSEHNIVLFNPAAEQIFQIKQKDALGKPLSILLPDNVQQSHHEHVAMFGESDDSHARLMSSRAEIQGKRQDGSLFDAEASICKSSIDGTTYFTAFLRDITERRKAEEEIRRLAMYDSLTGLANRHHFESVLKTAIAFANRFPDNKISLLLLDLDLFKQVNDTYGHAVGDALLIRIAEILQKNVRDADTVGRFGGDEFAILLQGIDTSEQVAKVAEKLINALSKPHTIEGHEIDIGVSIGITFCPEFGTGSEQLLKQADKMMYKSKDAGRNTYRIYSQGSTDSN
ncbi:MAG: diguanylate cyclase [Gammaproteobacteria bacterium]|nr:diguanylate cyclase [Gammaproteobacteria bacterium]